jgi:hypothetical protein
MITTLLLLDLVWQGVFWRGKRLKPRVTWNEAHAGDIFPSRPNVEFGKSCVEVYAAQTTSIHVGGKNHLRRRGNRLASRRSPRPPVHAPRRRSRRCAADRR